jgi:hypothetical protein
VRTNLLVVATLAALVSPAVPTIALAQSANFDVALRGQTVGSASYRFVPKAGGVTSESTTRLTTKGVEYAFSKTEQLTAAHQLKSAEVNAVVNGVAVHLTAAVEGAEIKLDISANGRTSTAKLPAHGAAVFLPDFDPGALETLLHLAAARNSADLWLVIPRQTGTVQAVKVATYPNEKGTLDGKQIVVHHLVATCDGASVNLFASEANNLLQAELPQAGFTLVRKGFVLAPPAKAPPPPADDAAVPPAQQ